MDESSTFRRLGRALLEKQVPDTSVQKERSMRCRGRKDDSRKASPSSLIGHLDKLTEVRCVQQLSKAKRVEFVSCEHPLIINMQRSFDTLRNFCNKRKGVRGLKKRSGTKVRSYTHAVICHHLAVRDVELDQGKFGKVE